MPGITTFFFGDAHSYEVKGVKKCKEWPDAFKSKKDEPKDGNRVCEVKD